MFYIETMHQTLTALYFVNPSTLIRFFSVEVKKISDRILSLDNINVEKLLPEILKILKLDNKKSMAVLEHPNGSGNVGEKFHFELREREILIICQGDRDSETADH